MNFALELLPGTFVICRLDPDAPIPNWAMGAIVSITRTSEELSIVCEQEEVPQDVQAERGWQCLRVAGKLDFSLVGVIARLTTTLAEAGISVFVVSSYDTDFVLVRESDLEDAITALRQAGHTVVGQT
jgi:hypothetical protein